MVNIVPQTGLGDILGSGFGAGLAQGTQSVVDSILKSLAKRKELEHYANLSGAPRMNSMPSDALSEQDYAELLQSLKGEAIGADSKMGQSEDDQIDTSRRDLQFDPDAQKFKKTSNLKEALTFEKPQSPFIPTDIKDFATIAQMRQKENLAREKMIAPMLKEIEEERKGAKKNLDAIRIQKKIIESGKGGPLSWDNLMSKLGLRTWMSPEGQIFQSQLLGFMEGMRDLFGVRITDADLKLILDKLPDIGRDPKTNRMILDLFELSSKYKVIEGDAADLIMGQAEKSGVVPKDLTRRINLIAKDVFEPEREKVLQNVETLLDKAKGKKGGQRAEKLETSYPIGTERRAGKRRQVWTGKEWKEL